MSSLILTRHRMNSLLRVLCHERVSLLYITHGPCVLQRKNLKFMLATDKAIDGQFQSTPMLLAIGDPIDVAISAMKS